MSGEGDEKAEPREEGEAAALEEDPYRLERLSRLSCKVGIVSMGMGMVAPCFCWFPWLLALPLSAFGATMARWAYDHAEPKTADRAYAKVGLVTNVTALVLALMFNLTLASWVGFFGLLVVLD